MNRPDLVEIRWWQPALPWWGWVACALAVVVDATIWWAPDAYSLPWTGGGALMPGTLTMAAVAVAATRTLPRVGRVAQTAAGVVTLAVVAGVSWALRGESFSLVQFAQVAMNAAAEEATFRVALPALLVVALGRLVGRGWATVVALVGSAVVFLTAPGHLHQVAATDQQVLVAVSFVAVALLWGAVLWTTGALAAVMANHAALNLLTGLAEDGYLDGSTAMALRYAATALMLAMALRPLLWPRTAAAPAGGPLLPRGEAA